MRWKRLTPIFVLGPMLALVTGIAPASAATLPGPPTQLLAISGHGNARLGWFAPADDGGSDITGYRVHVSDGTTRSFGADLVAHTIPALTNGVSYTFTVSAVNAVGEGAPSAPSGAVTPRPRAGDWSNVASMGTARIAPLATTLGDGRVLVVGGRTSAGTAIGTATIYNPATNAWSSAGTPGARTAATLTRLTNGRVLLAGGFDGSDLSLGTARLYNPGTNTWTSTGPMTYSRGNAAAVRLSNGRVLVTGGRHSVPGTTVATASAELYNPASNTWTSTGLMSQAREGLSLTTVSSATGALAAGGSAGGGGFVSAERYSAASGTWSPTGSMGTSRDDDDMCCKTALMLADGRTLVAGGWRFPDGPLRSAEVYRPGTGTWGPVAAMRLARQAGAPGVLLADGRVLVVGGSDDFGALGANEIYDPTSNTWIRPDDLHFARAFPAAVRLSSGRVLVVGGSNVTGNAQASAEVFIP